MGTLPTVADDALQLLDALDLLFSEAKISEEHRAELRVSFLRPVTILPEAPERQPISAFSRDLSPFGIGLLHNVPVDLQDVLLRVPLGHGGALHLRVRIKWCEACGEGWYFSGGRFLGVTSAGEQGPADWQPANCDPGGL